jgi:hypothetical protein
MFTKIGYSIEEIEQELDWWNKFMWWLLTNESWVKEVK